MRGLLRSAALPVIAVQPNVCRNSQGLASRGLPNVSLLASHRQRAKSPGRKRVGNARNAASRLRPLSTRVLERNRHVHPNVFPAHPARNLRRQGYVSKSVSFGIIHCLYLVGIWNSSQTIPVPCSSGAPSSRFDSLDTAANSPSTSSSVGMTRRISAAGSGLSVCA